MTSVEQAAIRYGSPDQQWLGTITVDEAREYLAAGEFPAGLDGAEDRSRHRLRGTRRRASASSPPPSTSRAPSQGRGGTHIVGAMIITNARILTFDRRQSRAGFRQRRDPAGRHDRRGDATGHRGPARQAKSSTRGGTLVDARSDQLPYPSLQHARARHRAPRPRRRRTSRRS